MKATTRQTGLIRPFNMDQLEYIAMYHEAPPEDLTLRLFLCTREERCPECGDRKGVDGLTDMMFAQDPESVLLEVVKSCIKKSAFPDTKSQVILWGEDDEERQVISDIPLVPLQDSWISSDLVHVQVGFHSWSPFSEVLRTDVAQCVAMNAYDSICVNAKSIDPAVQSAFQATDREDVLFRLAVNSVYAARIGIWCEPLVALRNEVMVKVRATIQEDDPEAEWMKFCDAGFSHYLECDDLFENSHEEE